MKGEPKPTFIALGIPFALFEAPAGEASHYHGLGTCTICGQPDRHCFEMGIGTDLIIPCPNCNTQNALDADGCWWQHSWVLEPSEGKPPIIETTNKRLLYFGVVLTPEESQQFLRAETGQS